MSDEPEAAVMMLSIFPQTEASRRDGFSKAAVTTMFLPSNPDGIIVTLTEDDRPTWRDFLILRFDDADLLRIPWPDGLTLDQALLAWAKTVQT